MTDKSVEASVKNNMGIFIMVGMIIIVVSVLLYATTYKSDDYQKSLHNLTCKDLTILLKDPNVYSGFWGPLTMKPDLDKRFQELNCH